MLELGVKGRPIYNSMEVSDCLPGCQWCQQSVPPPPASHPGDIKKTRPRSHQEARAVACGLSACEADGLFPSLSIYSPTSRWCRKCVALRLIQLWGQNLHVTTRQPWWCSKLSSFLLKKGPDHNMQSDHCHSSWRNINIPDFWIFLESPALGPKKKKKESECLHL